MNFDEISKKIQAEITNDGDMSESLLKKLRRATTGKSKTVKITDSDRQEIYSHNGWDDDYEGYFMFNGRQVVVKKDSIYTL